MLHRGNAERPLWEHVLHHTVLMCLERHQLCYAFWPSFKSHGSPILNISLHEVGKAICHKTASNTDPDDLPPVLVIGAGNGPSATPGEVIEKEQALVCTSCDGWLFYLIFVLIGCIIDVVEVSPASALSVPRIRTWLRTRCQKMTFEVIWQQNPVMALKLPHLFCRGWPDHDAD